MQRLSIEEYAALESALGRRVFRTGEVIWQRTRPCFYRPLVLYEAVPSSSVLPPALSWLGGIQYVAPIGVTGNSALAFRVFSRTAEYSLESLKRAKRWLVKAAARRFVIQPITDLQEFQEKGHRAYLSFHDRTHYRYMAQRRFEEHFARWAATLLTFPKVLLLGGYDTAGLRAVAVGYWINDTLHHSTFFSDTEALREHISDLMLHTIRSTAAATPAIRQICAGTYEGGIGRDRFYELRGCEIVRKPAVLRLNPAAGLFIRSFLPGSYAKLIGTDPPRRE